MNYWVLISIGFSLILNVVAVEVPVEVVLEEDETSSPSECPHSLYLHVHLKGNTRKSLIIKLPDCKKNIYFPLQLNDNTLFWNQKILYSTHYISDWNTFYHYHIMSTVICNNLNIKGMLIVGTNVFIISPQPLVYGKNINIYLEGNSNYINPNIEFDVNGILKHNHLHFNPKLMPKRNIELIIMADKSFMDKYISRDIAAIHLIECVTYLNMIFQQISFTIYPVKILFDHSVDISSNIGNLDMALSNISYYRRTHLTSTKHDALIFMSALKLPKISGKAYISGMCSYERSVALVSESHKHGALQTAVIMAHEIGHLLAIEHDDKSHCFCYDKIQECILAKNPDSPHTLLWSNCSIHYLKSVTSKGIDYCLKDSPGTINTVDNHLKQLCQISMTAECWSGDCCDMTTCKLKPQGTLCYKSTDHECRQSQYCNGYSELCPLDVGMKSNQICNEGKGLCYHGNCVSPDKVCQEVFGSQFTSASNRCYRDNIKGSAFQGYCSYTVAQDGHGESGLQYKFIKCDLDDVQCGVLKCERLKKLEESNKNNQLNWENVLEDINKINLGRSVCYFARYNTNLTGLSDPLMVQDGAPCGADKFCLNNKCRPREE